MATLLQFGAGNIGRGFIAPLFAAAGWRVVFVEVAPALLAALQERGGYRVELVDGETVAEQTIDEVEVIDGRDRQAVAAAVAGADLLATAVGLAVLPRLGGGIADGLAERWQHGSEALDILLCENGVAARELLGAAVREALPAALRPVFAERCGLVRASIGRMIPPSSGDDPLAIRVEPYAKLPLDGAAFRGSPPTVVAGVKLVEPFDLAEQQKLYLHNGTHAALAYAGQRRGHQTLVACMADAELVEGVRSAGREIAAALAQEHGRDAAGVTAIRAACEAMLDDLLRRYANPALGDTVARVARDPFRKLALDDRLIGALRLCHEHHLPCDHLSRLVLEALRYQAADDEPRAAEWNAAVEAGWRRALQAATGLPDDDGLFAHLASCEAQA